jgi:hypothetical protein
MKLKNNFFKLFTIKLLSIFFFFLTLSCSDQTPKLEGKPPVAEKPPEKISSNTVFNGSVDILFVVDDSGSMGSHQINLGKNLDVFVKEITQGRPIDYRIGVISTSSRVFGAGSGGQLNGNPKWVDRNTPNAVMTLRSNLSLGISGDPEEKVFDPVFLALTEPNLSNANKGFYRKESHLVLIFITDAEDQSQVISTPQQFYDFLKVLKGGNTKKILTYGVIVPSDDQMNCQRDSFEKPVRLETFFKLSKGQFYGLCDADYGLKLGKLAANIAKEVGRYIYLNTLPNIKTIRVVYGNQIVKSDFEKGWSYDPEFNAIVFGSSMEWSDQPDGTQVEVFFDPLIEDPKGKKR